MDQEGDGNMELGWDGPERLGAEGLPAALGAGLTPSTRQALGHPVRRRILRTLNESAATLSPTDLASSSIPRSRVSVVSYHARVLHECGSVGVAQVSATGEHFYASVVADDEEIVSVLRATEDSDAARRR
jgi:DNA-binding transcriptional ArsR family regulator